MKLIELLIRANAFTTRAKWNRANAYVFRHWPTLRRFDDSHVAALKEAIGE